MRRRVAGLNKQAGCARRESVLKVSLQLKLAYGESFKIHLVGVVPRASYDNTIINYMIELSFITAGKRHEAYTFK